MSVCLHEKNRPPNKTNLLEPIRGRVFFPVCIHQQCNPLHAEQSVASLIVLLAECIQAIHVAAVPGDFAVSTTHGIADILEGTMQVHIQRVLPVLVW